MSHVAPARAAAFEILLTLERGSGHSDELLHRPAIERLSPQDRNLATNLVMGTLRWQIALDANIKSLLARPETRLHSIARVSLRLGAFQLLYLDRVPVYAAIGESVELAKTGGQPYAAGMVNAVLRKIAAQSRKKVPDTVTNTTELAAICAHPEWLVERWVSNFGLQAARQICEYDQQPAPTFVRLLETEAEQELLAEGVELAPARFLANVRTVTRGDVSSTAAFREGRVRIQDEGSQLVAELAGPGLKILDSCAAPGGKAAILAERNPSASITACDVSKKRLSDMQRTLRNQANIDFRLADIAKKELEPEFDLVLCDAPCSGTGTLARNPEIRHRLRPEELKRQHERQVAILKSVMRGVSPGERLLYSTCSLEPEENETVIHECLRGRDDFKLVRIDGEVERLERAGILLPEGAKTLRKTALVNGCLRTLPGVHACDGFFAALLIRHA
ncbi:16S rRNA (cytosine(967)-C(5))-methyltransferase RsmB [Alloacidobacterium sp.]|uniref:16S rRNA (cytosine(967)-C(5))-methyltransferase RsmB n=1 Tax=Alloacidobacterium sp. TaxID=2951999 RepID=UPI002D4C99AD|nr:16S rRNA (cytosine(967)-C(5))-methyltransferase RsmB [Alloacidobacterium sp.]HYK34371.1 16S rRNA (cytosine(967)-C(5))-methyltransferase RsmB [Alloacidobacterium sp.]